MRLNINKQDHLENDVEAHGLHADVEGIEGVVDSEGHRMPQLLDEDDVAGHGLEVQPPRDTDIQGHGFSVQPPRDADNSGTQF